MKPILLLVLLLHRHRLFVMKSAAASGVFITLCLLAHCIQPVDKRDFLDRLDYNARCIPQVADSAAGTVRASLILLHGLGGHGRLMRAYVEFLRNYSDVFRNFKFETPTAPSPPGVNASSGTPNSWFVSRPLQVDDYDDFMVSYMKANSSNEDVRSLEHSAKQIRALVKKTGLPSKCVALFGVSQGGAMALYTGLTFKGDLMGVVASSAWLPAWNEFPKRATIHGRRRHYLQTHNMGDSNVFFSFGNKTAAYMRKFAANHAFRTYTSMEHPPTKQALLDIAEYLLTRYNMDCGSEAL